MPKHIILVEDDPLISDLYATILKSGGYDVTPVLSSEKAVDVITKIQPTLIVLDLMMPLMDGMEVLTNLQIKKETKHIPVVMFSNILDPQIEKQALEKGALKFALKSDYYRPKMFLEMIGEVLLSKEENKTEESGD
jgi:CheY-like chemotaxis protein